jgi:hypothetical protein
MEQHIGPKYQYTYTNLHDVATQKIYITALCVVTGMLFKRIWF